MWVIVKNEIESEVYPSEKHEKIPLFLKHKVSSKGVQLMVCGLDHSGSQPFIYKYKNQVGCRDDTMPKTVDIYKKALRGGVKACNNLPQPLKTKM